ncbi:unnamed protein product [Ectocarpus sp. CCAP 1310/34]|nr:unnamed protein product [Ectocarpus sp. CCAP 1310/34]
MATTWSVSVSSRLIERMIEAGRHPGERAVTASISRPLCLVRMKQCGAQGSGKAYLHVVHAYEAR